MSSATNVESEALVNFSTKNALIERIDSDRTDESPFGSALTTPVDEDVVLFDAVKSRRMESSDMYYGPQDEEAYELISKDGGLLKVIGHDEPKLTKSSSLQSLITPRPSMERLNNGKVPVATVVESEQAPAPRLTAQGTAAEETSSTLGQNTDLLRETLDALLHTPSILAERPVVDKAQDETEVQLVTNHPVLDANNQDNDDIEEDSAIVTKYILSLLPFARQSPLDDLAYTTDPSSPFEALSKLSLKSLFIVSLRILVFIPWCILAGATIVLFPEYLETVVFGPGYVNTPSGIYRYAFLMDVAKELAGIFLGALGVLWYLYPQIGVLVITAAMAKFVHRWQDFKVDRDIALGQDDMQSLYHVYRYYVSGDDATLALREESDGYYLGES